MKKILLSLVALTAVTVSSVSAQAPQGWTFGPKVGMTISNYSGVDDTKALVGFTAGGFVEYGLNNEWLGLSLDVLYAGQGGQFKDRPSYPITDRKVTADYLNVPVLANFYLIRGLAVKTGLQPGFLLGAKYHSTEGGVKSDVDYKDYVKSFALALPLGLSYSFDFGLIVDARVNFPLTKTANRGDIIFKNTSNISAVIAVGWRF